MTEVRDDFEKFSVLMSVYYREDPTFFYDAICSVFKNTIIPNDVVVVVDGPITDSLNDTIKKLQDIYLIKFIFLKKNVGLGRALNIGVEHCKYDLIMRMDTDDYCIETRFEDQLRCFYKNKNLSLVGGFTAEYDESMSNFTGIRNVACGYDSIKTMAKKRNPFNHMTVAFRKKAILSVGGYKHHLYMEDYNLWLRIIAKGYLVENIPKVLVNVRAGDGMLSRRKGVMYIYSEYELYKLKKDLGIDTLIHSTIIFLMRVFTRVLPLSSMKYLYSKLRTHH